LHFRKVKRRIAVIVLGVQVRARLDQYRGNVRMALCYRKVKRRKD